MLASFPTVWLAPRTVTLVPNYGLIDDNWHLDASFKALRGIWVGRDVAFTHGPLYQLLSSIPARSMPLSVGALYATWNTIPIWCAFLFAYLTLRLLIPEQPPWKRFVLLLLLCSFWETSLRTTFPVLLFALFLRGWYAVREGDACELHLWNCRRFAVGHRFPDRRRHRRVCDGRMVYRLPCHRRGDSRREVRGQAALRAAGILRGCGRFRHRDQQRDGLAVRLPLLARFAGPGRRLSLGHARSHDGCREKSICSARCSLDSRSFWSGSRPARAITR